MDFVMELSISARKKNLIWVIVDGFTKSSHYLPIRDKEGAKLLYARVI